VEAYSSDRSVELPLRPSAIAAPPSGPSLLNGRLQGWGSEVGGEGCQWALTHRHVSEGHLRLCNDVATGSMRPSSPAP
jgi:hypothetical protein